MVNISIDVTDLGGEARPGDKVVLWKPAAAGSATHAGRVISTAPVDVFLTNGKATVPDVEPGSMRVLLQCRGVESQGPISVTVPDGTGTVTLRSLIESQFEYSPPIVSAVQEAAANASASEEAAIRAQVRSERAADRADAKVDDAINNGAALVRDEVKQDADRAVSARQAAVQSETNAKASEGKAAASESNAATSETNAKQSETNARASEESAGSSETEARASRNSAVESALEAGSYADTAQAHSKQVVQARDEVIPLAEKVATDASATAAHREHVDDQVSAIDTAFTESIPPYLQPDSPTGLAQTYGTKGYIYEAGGEVETLFNPPRADVTISAALPGVTLAQVQSIDSAANLSDSADWYLLQSLINDCAARNVKDIKIPRGTYYLSRGLDLSGLEYGTRLDMTGVTLRAVAEMPHVITLEHRGNYWKARRIQIIGLEIRGQYLAQRGINIEGVQEWSIDARVHGCYTGVTISDTWYGKFSRETIIQDCLTGVAFLKKGTSEINTIGFDNLKINFAVPKSNFTKSTGESSVGIRIETFMGGIDFHTIVIEGPDYGVKYVSTTEGGGVNQGLVMFTGAYWENIKERIFDFSEMSKTGYVHAMNSLIVRGNRFNAPAAKPSVFGPGNHEITGNQPLNIEVVNSPFSRVVLRIDINVNLAKEPTSAQVFVDRTPSVPTDINVARFAPWGNSSSYPTGEGMLYTTEHAAHRTQPSPDKLRGKTAEPSRLFPKNSVTTKPTTYYPTVGGGPNGPVLWSNGSWYMLILGDGGTVTARQVKNIHRLDEGVNDYTGKELHLMSSVAAVGTKAFCIEANVEFVMGEWGGAKRWVDSNGSLRIGTTAELVESSATLGNGNRVFDISTGQALWKSGSGLQLYDWFGELTSVRAAGTLAQRPATAPEQMIYFNTDSSDYSRYESGEWVAHVPNVTS